MKTSRLTILVLAIALALLIALPNLSWGAEDGGALYKAKCAVCHGADGAGKPAAKIPALKGISLSEAKIAEFIGKGEAGKKAPHTTAIKGVTEEQAKAIAKFVKELK